MFQGFVSLHFARALMRTTAILFTVGFTGILQASCGAPPATPRQQIPPFGDEYVVRVIDATSQSVIQGAMVSLDIQGDGSPTVEYTDSEGIFRFRLFINSTKSAAIRVVANDYNTYTRNITIVPGQFNFEDIRLVRLDLTIAQLAPTTTIEANVTTATATQVVQNVSSPIPTQPQSHPVIRPSKTFTVPAPTVPATNPPVSGCIDILDSSWHLEGSGPLEAYDGDMGYKLQGRTFIRVTFDLHGFTILPGDASAIFFDQPPRGAAHYASLADYAENGKDGMQTVNIPLSAIQGLNLNDAVGTLHTRFWSESGNNYTVDVSKIMACS